ncbi:hypothetical protein H0H93_001698 [Arthromyces matolae]|nr:hypothetical protein H0H93_001698 [Arthromyces matolae]
MKFVALFTAALFAVASASPTGEEVEIEARQYGSRCPSVQAFPFYRLYNPTVNDHFYTTNVAELNAAGYNSEGISSYIYTTLQPGTVPFYRLYNPTVFDHFYTTSANERDNAINNDGYNYEGIAGYVFPNRSCGGTPFYRLYGGSTGTDHFYTTSASERNAAENEGYNYEGIAAYVYPA